MQSHAYPQLPFNEPINKLLYIRIQEDIKIQLGMHPVHGTYIFYCYTICDKVLFAKLPEHFFTEDVVQFCDNRTGNITIETICYKCLH